MSKPLNCPSCKSPIRSEDINISSLVAKCSNCHTVFQFEQEIAKPVRKRQEVIMPPGIEAYHLASELNIEISWRKSLSGFFVFFTIFWNAIVLPMALFAVLSGAYFMLLFMSIHLAIGIGFLYYILASLWNTTYITVDQFNLSIEHKPLKMPFYPNRYIPTHEFEQFYVEKYSSGKTNGRPVYAFGLFGIKKDKERIKLVKGLKYPKQALYLEQEIERFLKMPDHPVEEEWKG